MSLVLVCQEEWSSSSRSSSSSGMYLTHWMFRASPVSYSQRAVLPKLATESQPHSHQQQHLSLIWSNGETKINLNFSHFLLKGERERKNFFLSFPLFLLLFLLFLSLFNKHGKNGSNEGRTHTPVRNKKVFFYQALDVTVSSLRKTFYFPFLKSSEVLFYYILRA